MKRQHQATKQNDFPGLFSGLMLGHLILLMHVLLLAGIVLLVIFFRGIIAYMPLILIAGFSLAGAGAYYLFRWLRSSGKGLRDILNSPALSGKSFEIKLLGGVASFKVESHTNDHTLPAIDSEVNMPLQGDHKPARIIELPDSVRNTDINPINPVDHHNRTERKLFKWKK